MKFSVNSSGFLKDIQAISGAVGTGAVLPILEDFLFELKGNKLTVKASDLETTMIAEVEVEGKEDGKIAIPAKLLLETLKSLPDQKLSVTVNKNLSIEIKATNGNYKLTGENGDDFPKGNEIGDASELSLSGKTLLDAINKSLFAVSSDEMRPAMTGVFMELDKGGTTFVATDAHKLVKYTTSEISSSKRASFIVPKKAMSLLKAAISESDDVQVSYNQSNAFFQVGNNIQLISRLIDSKYPDYDKVIPKGNNNILTVNRLSLFNALKRIALFSSKTTNQVVFHIKENELALSAKDLDYSNEAKEKMTCMYNGEPMDIAFNAKFLLEILSVLEDEEVEFQLANPSRAGLIEPTQQKENTDLTMLVMPIMLNA